MSATRRGLYLINNLWLRKLIRQIQRAELEGAARGDRALANLYRHTFLLSSPFVHASIKQTWQEGGRTNVPNTPQKRNVFSFIHPFFRHHSRHIVNDGNRIYHFATAQRGRSVRSHSERKSSKDSGSHRQNASHRVCLSYPGVATRSHFIIELGRIWICP